MLSQDIAMKVLDQGLDRGADFAELFVERNVMANLQTLNSDVDSVRSGIDFGVGVRLVYGHEVLYGYTNLAQAKSLSSVVDQLTIGRKSNSSKKVRPLNKSQELQRHSIASKPLSLGHFNDEKLAFLLEADASAKSSSDKIETTKGNVSHREQWIEIFNSEGLHVTDTRHYVRAGLTAIAVDGHQATGNWNSGGLVGWELADLMSAKFMGGEASRQALVNLSAKPCPSGRMPVVIGHGFGGVIFHEACGHLLETTSVAKKASVFHDKYGEMIAAPCVNAVDEGVSLDAWGSLNIDDEGMPTQRTQLIKDGKLENFLVDRMGHLMTGYERSGSGRRQSYRFAPASRMRNTYIEPGTESVDDMIASIDKGIYASHMGGGSVQPGTGEFNFAVVEGYYVENGKIQYPVKAATLISTGPEVLQKISMVGSDFKLACGMCGSVSGSIPASVGQATIKVDDILVGGNA